MKLFLILILSITFTTIANGQQAPTGKSNNIEYIIYGRYCGECVHRCALMYKLVNNKLLIDTTDDYFFPRSPFGLMFNDKPLNNKQYLKAKKILDSIPEILFKAEDKNFGEPDNRDQCGYFIQLKMQNKLKTFHIDTDLKAIPIELRNFVGLIEENCNEQEWK